MTGREWMKTPEGQKRLQEEAEELIKRYEPHIAYVSARVSEAQEALRHIFNTMDLDGIRNAIGQIDRSIASVNASQMNAKDMGYIALPPDRRESPVITERFLRNLLARNDEQVKTPPFLEYHDGNLYTRGKLIDFRDRNAAHFLVAKALVLVSDHEGFLSYEDINRQVELAGKRKIRRIEEQRSRISNALQTLKRDRQRQKTPFPTELPDGSPVIRTIPGKGLILAKV